MTTPRVAYLLNRFPKLSETFVTDEILALERRGTRAVVCSLRPGSASDAPREAQHLIRRRICFGALSPAVFRAQWHWLLRSPLRLAAVWARTIASHASSPRVLAAAVLALTQAATLARELERRRIDHLHAHWATHSALAAWVIHRLSGLSYSFTTHADDLYVRRPMLEEKVGAARFVVAISAFGARFLESQLRDPDTARVRVVRCGVEVDRFRPLPPPGDDEIFTIACIARLEPKKGHRVLLDACALLAERGVAFRCVLVGEGRERAALERTCDDPRLRGRVEMLGAQPRNEVEKVIGKAHVVALPCRVEPSGRADGIPVALMDAMALERPVVSTTVAGVPELVEDGRSGLLVEPDDPEALADALEQLRDDPARARRLAAAGRRRVREAFDVDVNAGRLALLFASAPDDPSPEDIAKAGTG